MSLKTKNVFLTGGAKGLGKSFIDALLEAGASVFFGDINESLGKQTEKEFQAKYGQGRVKFSQFDCTDHVKFEEAFAAAVEFLGFVDLMVNNAGMVSEARWKEVIQLNFMAMVKGTFLAEDHMRKDKGGKGGRIINISSVCGLKNQHTVPVYVGTKNAIRSFTSCLALAPDSQARGIEFGVLCPDSTATDLFKEMDGNSMRYFDSFAPEFLASLMAPVEYTQKAFMKLVTLEEMNGAILYCSDKETTFRRMDNVSVGESWPPEEGQRDETHIKP